MTTPDTNAGTAHALALRARLENLVEWIHLELSKNCMDAEATYERATKIVDVVAEMRFVDPAIAAAMGGIQ
jgi:hypothetical protein